MGDLDAKIQIVRQISYFLPLSRNRAGKPTPVVVENVARRRKKRCPSLLKTLPVGVKFVARRRRKNMGVEIYNDGQRNSCEWPSFFAGAGVACRAYVQRAQSLSALSG